MSTPHAPHRNHPPRRKPLHELASRNARWYRLERPKWIAALGGKCAVCGSTEDLEFDHNTPRDWEPNKTSRWQRLRNYIREIREGKIRALLCRECNARKGYPDGQRELLEKRREEPF